MSDAKITDKIMELAEPIAMSHNYYIVDITYRREAGKFILRILADKKGGITLDECAEFNNELSEILDNANVISDEGYLLEVASPGLDRKLNTKDDFSWAVGKKVNISTYGPIEGRNVFKGTILGVSGESVVIEEKGISTEIPMDKISKAKLLPDIDWSEK